MNSPSFFTPRSASLLRSMRGYPGPYSSNVIPCCVRKDRDFRSLSPFLFSSRHKIHDFLNKSDIFRSFSVPKKRDEKARK